MVVIGRYCLHMLCIASRPMWSLDGLLYMFRCHPIHMSSSHSCPMGRRRTMMSRTTSRRRNSVLLIRRSNCVLLRHSLLES